MLDIGAKKIIVHSSGIKYSPILERGIKENRVQLVISADSGWAETYEQIKNVNQFECVWANIKKYAEFQSADERVLAKYVIVPSVNDDNSEVNAFLQKVVASNIKTIVLDIEHDFYFENKKNSSKMLKLLEFCEAFKNKAKNIGIKVHLYNTATYLYDSYKLLVPFYKYKTYFQDIMILAIPILIGELGHTLVGATDVLVVARYGIDSLAAISIANSILFTLFVFGIGFLLAVSVILPNLRGTKQKIKKYLPSTLFFSLIMAIFSMIICYLSKYSIPYFGFEQHLVPYIQEYISIVSFSMIGAFIFEGIKQFLQSYEIVKFPNLLLLFAVLVNLLFDIVFVFGFGPIPAMGSKGAAFATCGVRTFIGLVMLIYVFKFIDFKSKLDFSYMKQIFKVGLPIALALLIELFAFNIITILVGKESGVFAATHNILVTIASATFMIPLSISIALSVKVAYNYGAKKCHEIRNYSVASTVLSVGFMAFTALVLALFPKQIINLFTDNREVLDICLPIISIVAMYQVFDGFQIVMGGILKGFKMTKFVSDSFFIGYWVVGAPVAAICVLKYGLSLQGYWIALAVALFTIGIVQAVMAKHKFKKIKEICN